MKAECKDLFLSKLGLFMVPRMHRAPKPKSIYRCLTRAPGIGHFRKVCDLSYFIEGFIITKEERYLP